MRCVGTPYGVLLYHDCPAVTARSEEDTYAYEITLAYFEYETCTVIKRIVPVVCF